MQSIRIVRLPTVKAAYSGPLTDEKKFEAFNDWFSAYHASLTNELYPLFHIVSPGDLYAEGISIEDLYFPIERRK